MLSLAFLSSPVWAQSVAVMKSYPLGIGTIYMAFSTDSKGNALNYGWHYNFDRAAEKYVRSVAWIPLPVGNGAYQAHILTRDIPAVVSSKHPVAEVKPKDIYYTSVPAALAAFNDKPLP